jgi:hypothetical protein
MNYGIDFRVPTPTGKALRGRAGTISLSIALLFALTGAVSGASITFAPAATTQAGPAACGDFPGYVCTTTAYFNSGTLFDQDDTDISPLFTTAFENWNAANGDDWTLQNGGELPGSYNITTSMAQQFSDALLGGLTIQIDTSGVTLPTVGVNQHLVWSQGLYVNITPGPGTIVPSYYAMDTAALSNLTCGVPTLVLCGPAYPYQYPDDSFYDQPKDYYMAPGATQAFFDANAYVSVEDFTNPNAPVLTVYDGISYGFQNVVSPEPGTWLLLGGGFGALLVLGKRRRV